MPVDLGGSPASAVRTDLGPSRSMAAKAASTISAPPSCGAAPASTSTLPGVTHPAEDRNPPHSPTAPRGRFASRRCRTTGFGPSIGSSTQRPHGRERGCAERFDLVIAGGGPVGFGGCLAGGADRRQSRCSGQSRVPHDKPCGDGLNARAVSYLQKMGPGRRVASFTASTG